MNLRPDKRLLMLTLIAALPVLAADGLNVKTGTWETTVVTKTSGMAMPADAMANMNAQQRAQMEAMMKNMGASAPRTITEKSCVTDKDLKEGAFRQRAAEQDSKCTYKQIAGSGNRQEMTFECPSKRGTSTGHMVVNATNSGNVSGQMSIKAEGMTIESTFTSKWLSATCAAEDK